MPQRIDNISYGVWANGVDISNRVVRATTKFGVNQRMAEAHIDLTELPSGVDFWQTLRVEAGLVSTGGDTYGQTLRFDGYIYDIAWDLYPDTVRLDCRGPLILADVKKSIIDEEWLYGQGLAPPEIKFWPAGEPMWFDFRNSPPTPWGDAEMIAYVLEKCGLSSRIGTILGTAYTLGSVSLNWNQFVWRRRQSGLEFIDTLDQVCLGLKTFEALRSGAHTIERAQITPLAPFDSTSWTFWEGRDLFEGSTMDRNNRLTRNRVIVEGWDLGNVRISWMKSKDMPDPGPPGVDFMTEYVSSPLIAVGPSGNPALGISAEDVATWKLEELGQIYLEGRFITWRDEPLSAGQRIYLVAPRLSLPEPGQEVWVVSAEMALDCQAAEFTQTCDVRAIPYWGGPGASALGGALPITLGGSS
jgi:hypothetical protein